MHPTEETYLIIEQEMNEDLLVEIGETIQRLALVNLSQETTSQLFKLLSSGFFVIQKSTYLLIKQKKLRPEFKLKEAQDTEYLL